MWYTKRNVWRSLQNPQWIVGNGYRESWLVGMISNNGIIMWAIQQEKCN